LPNRIFRYALYASIALTAFAAGIWVSGSRQAGPPDTTASEALFAIALPDLNGSSQALGQWRGKVVAVNFWATWCAPCREEIPVFVRMQEKYGAKGLQFVGISIDQADKTAEFVRNFSINYPTLIGTFDSVEVSRQAGNKLRVLPYTVFLNRKGKIVATELGGLNEEKLEAIINAHL
jgi:thiol-disulfide isomerase/thioredoxin